MMCRSFKAALTAAGLALATLAVPLVLGVGVSDAQATTVKSSKSNTSQGVLTVRKAGGLGMSKAKTKSHSRAALRSVSTSGRIDVKRASKAKPKARINDRHE